MVSRFAEAESIVSTTNDAWYGEETRIVPMAKGQYFAASVNGEFLDVVGIVDINPVTVVAQDEGGYDGMQPGLAGERMHVSYDLSLFTDLLRVPKQGDEIWMLTRETHINLTDVRGVPLTDIIGNPLLAGKYLAKWRVTRVDPDGIGRVVCVCTKAA
jgi:hypothetical protein